MISMADGSSSEAQAGKAKAKKLPFGNRRAGILCNLSRSAQLNLIAEGLPIVLASAQGFWAAASAIADRPREARVLQGFCEEECAKIMILMDLIRCPQRIVGDRAGKLVGTFYDHLGRLIYAEAQSWKPMHVTQLREYVDNARKGHYLEGNMGEFILPNASLYRRESTMYADIEVYEDGLPRWSAPTGLLSISVSFPPLVLGLAEAMQATGLFSRRGLQAASEIWDQVDFVEDESFEDSRRLTRQLFKRLDAEKLITEEATERHAGVLMNDWQMPMYNLDFKPVHPQIEDLRAQQEAMYWAEVGVDRGDY